MVKKTIPFSGLVFSILLGVSANLYADALVTNGSFEEPIKGTPGCSGSGSWFYCTSDTVPGWTVRKFIGGALFNLEFQTQPTLGIDPTDGLQYAELASHGNSDSRVVISQDVTVPFCTLDEYTLSYKARKRQGNDVLEVSIDGNDLSPAIVTGSWGSFSHDFYPASDSVTISFAEIGPSGTLGALLDEVTLVRKETGPSNCEVAIDIKFCSDPNGYNCKKKGVLPVTIFGTDALDVNDIDVDTLQLCDEELTVCTSLMPVDWSVADRGEPNDVGAGMCAIEQVCETIADVEVCEDVEMDYLNQDQLDDIDVAFNNVDVKDSLLFDFCSDDKGSVSDSLIIIGNLLDGSDIYSVPNGGSGTDVLWKANK